MDPTYAKLFSVRPRKGDLRKYEIVKAAIENLQQEGVERTTFEAIGKRLGLRKANVAYHFPDKSDIFKAAIQYVTSIAQDRVVDEIKKVESPEERLKAYVDASFDWLVEYPDHASTITLFMHYATVNEEYRDLFYEIQQVGISRIASLIEPDKKHSKKFLHAVRGVHGLIAGAGLGFACTQNHKNGKLTQEHLADYKAMTWAAAKALAF